MNYELGVLSSKKEHVFYQCSLFHIDYQEKVLSQLSWEQ